MKTRPGLGLLSIALVAAGLGLLFSASGPAKQASAQAGTPVATAPVTPSATPAPAVPASTAREVAAHDVIGSCWNAGQPPAFAEFRDWAVRYLAASPAARPALLAEGVKLAEARRAELAQLIRTDPELALALAVPMVVRQQLPADIVAQLEERVSGRGNLSLMATTAEAEQPAAQPMFHAAVIGDKQYTAYVYGRRENQATLIAPTSVIGVALDRQLAVSESPLRVLEPGELAAGRPISAICDVSGDTTGADASTPLNVKVATAAEYNGVIHVFCHIEHVTEQEAKLASQERDRTHNARLAADGESLSDSEVLADSYTQGTKKLLLILVDFSDKTGGSTTPAAALNLINGTNGVHDYYTSVSYGATNLLMTSTDVTPVLRMPKTADTYATANDYYGLHSDAEAAATTAGFAVNTYDRIGVILAPIGGQFSGWSGLGQVGGPDFWIQGFSAGVVAHEVGHTYGLYHSNLWKVTDGNPVSAAGTSIEYGDVFDVMGSASINNEFSHWNRAMLQWIPNAAIASGDNPGTYRVYRFDGGAASNLANTRAIRVVRDTTRDFWIGYRRKSGNASLNGGAYIIYGYKSNNHGDLLDMTTPGVNPGNVHDEGLAIGQTFSDAVSGITIKPLAQGGSGPEEYLDVQIGYQPRVSWAQTGFSADAGGLHALLTVSRTKNSTGTVSVNYATASGTAVSPTNFTAQSGTLTWADGDMADKTIDITLLPHAPAGSTTNFTATLSSPSGALLWGAATATVNVIDPGVRDPSYLAYSISNRVQKVLPLPDGSVIVGGAFGSIYDSVHFVSYIRAGITRVPATGGVDPTFAVDGGASGFLPSVVYDLARQPDGRIIVVGQFTGFNGVSGKNYIVRLLADGSLDPTFNAGAGANGIIYSVMLHPNGKILIGGAFTSFNGVAREYLARLNADGSLDATFTGPDFNGTSGGKVTSLALQPDGNLLAAGSFTLGTVANLCRVTVTGAPDAAFSGLTTGSNAAINKVVLQPDGRILLAGAFTTINGTARGGLARLTATGANDANFVPPASNGVCQTVFLEPDGSVLVGGASAAPRRLAHLSGTGTLDSAFNLAADVPTDVFDIALLANGRGIFGSNSANYQGAGYVCPLWEFSAGLTALPGTVQFGPTTARGTQGSSVTFSVNRTGGSTGALQVGYSTVSGPGHFTPVSGLLYWASGDTSVKTITVALTSGTLAGPTESCAINLGQSLLGGTLLGVSQQAVITIYPSAPPGNTNDFNGDGSHDILLENAATGERVLWLMGGPNNAYVIQGLSLGSLDPAWHIAGTADFNGDGKPDILLENTASGQRVLWLMGGPNNAYVTLGVDLGSLNPVWHIVATTDFNGDGNPDILLENSSSGQRVLWLMGGPNNAYVIQGVDLGSLDPLWHIAGTADFNGDGSPDILLENTASGQRVLWLMGGPYNSYVQLGIDLGSLPPAWHITGTADFNGDGKPDILLENTASGQRVLWLMGGPNNAYVTLSLDLGSLNPAWRIVK